MKHIVLLLAMAITCVLASVANVIVSRMVDINIFTFKLWFVIPVGAICLGMLGASGAILAARYFQVRPTVIDAALMVFVAATTMLLIYYLDYATFVLNDGRKASDLIDFESYVDLILTKSHMRVGRGAGVKTGEVGEMGYALAAIEFVGFLIGGAATFMLIKGLPRCADCGSYLRKLKAKKTKELTFDETDKLIDCFNRGDLSMVQEVIAWSPAERKLERNIQKAIITFNLLGCPKCGTEAIAVNVNAFNGKEWNEVPALKSRRDLTSGSSFRDRFA
jgi:hypothetical protein